MTDPTNFNKSGCIEMMFLTILNRKHVKNDRKHYSNQEFPIRS